MKQMLLEKFILLFLGMTPLFVSPDAASVLAFLASVVCASLSELLPDPFRAVLSCLLAAACLFLPVFLPFLPLFVYGSAKYDIRENLAGRLLPFLFGIALFANLFRVPPLLFYYILLLSILAWWMRRHCETLLHLKKQFFSYQDKSTEQTSVLERRNKELIRRQDYEIELATLNERTRIAREIHDNVGHLLTRSILQISAMQVVHKEDPDINGQLLLIRDTLNDAMENVRSSVHDLHDGALNLEISLKALIASFSFCPVSLYYDAGPLPKDVVYCFLAVSKEALSNTAKHSGASAASISVIEHPALYQLIIRDNGSTVKPTFPEVSGGMGLLNMQERVEALRGNFHARSENGFSVFISIPKMERNEKE